MTNLDLNDEQRAVAELARAIGTEALWPVARQADDSGAVPDVVWQRLFDTGLTVPVPEELGGSGIGDAATWMIALENLAYGDAGITLAATSIGNAALLLARHGGAEHEATLRQLVSDAAACTVVALYEPQGRGGAEFATTIAVADDGSARVSGHKVGVPFAATAQRFLVVGVDAATGQPSAVLVGRETAGVSVHPYGPTLGLGAAAWGSVEFDVVLPPGGVLCSSDDSDGVLTTLGVIRLSVGAIALGIAQRALDYASQYARERVAFGKPIAAFQGVSFPLAESRMRIDAARLEIAELAAILDTRDTGCAADHVSEISRAVVYATDVASSTTRAAVQTLGGHGYITEHPAELWYRNAATLSTLDADPLLSAFQPAL
jgi:alkylation response protein AidB-like acyl-CoA dehydrogenase